jgi:hypothetical protein
MVREQELRGFAARSHGNPDVSCKIVRFSSPVLFLGVVADVVSRRGYARPDHALHPVTVSLMAVIAPLFPSTLLWHPIGIQTKVEYSFLL